MAGAGAPPAQPPGDRFGSDVSLPVTGDAPGAEEEQERLLWPARRVSSGGPSIINSDGGSSVPTRVIFPSEVADADTAAAAAAAAEAAGRHAGAARAAAANAAAAVAGEVTPNSADDDFQGFSTEAPHMTATASSSRLLERESEAALRAGTAQWSGVRLRPVVTSPPSLSHAIARNVDELDHQMSSEYVALLPLSDERLRPWNQQRRTRILAVLAVAAVVVASAAAYVLVPREASVSLAATNSRLIFNASAAGGWQLIVEPAFAWRNAGFFGVDLAGDVQVRYLRSLAGNLTFGTRIRPRPFSMAKTVTSAGTINASFLPEGAEALKIIALYAAQCDFSQSVLFILRANFSAKSWTGARYHPEAIDTYFMAPCPALHATIGR